MTLWLLVPIKSVKNPREFYDVAICLNDLEMWHVDADKFKFIEINAIAVIKRLNQI